MRRTGIVKTGVYSLIGGLVSVIGCSSSTSDKVDVRKNVNPAVKYFDDWGFVDDIRHGNNKNYKYGKVIGGGYWRLPVDIELGDLDGDGDLDIIVTSVKSGIRIYENRMPQKR